MTLAPKHSLKPLPLSGRLLLIGLLCATAGPAMSQGQQTPAQQATRAATRADDTMRRPGEDDDRVHLVIGLVSNYSPEYSGSDKMGHAFAPAARIDWRGYSISRSSVTRASVRGAVAAGTPAGHLLLTSKHGSAERLAGQVGAVHVPDAAELVSRSDVLIVGLKPYVIPDVLPRLSEAIVASRPLVVSIAAGVPVERLESMLPGGTRVVRTMPNMAASVGESMTALAPGSSASAEDLETVRTLMETIGRTVILEEKDFVTVEDEVTGERRNVTYEKGQFVYRLSGRDRQRSASFYTPEVLTRFTVQQALEELLDQDGRTTSAEEILHLTVCEPALGSGAFAIEAVRQLAEQYLSRRERELGRRVDPEERPRELAKVKAFIALHQVYGVDLNATAVELAEVSLWLDTMVEGLGAPRPARVVARISTPVPTSSTQGARMKTARSGRFGPAPSTGATRSSS